MDANRMENVATNKQVDELFLFFFESTVDTSLLPDIMGKR